ncbi:MAG: VOC family protein [Chloroflexi bacterium]|nr:VOC family protein [Chloroflexota bacterium]MBE3114543.1 VOC family protein [Actinomycetota bacterium]
MSFDHMAFQVSDMGSSINFYTQKLGFKLNFRSTNEEEQEEYAFLEYGNARLELIQNLKEEYQKPEIKKPYCPHFCLEIENMKQSVEILKKNNVHIIRGPLEIKDEETWVYFSDPDNNILEYIKWYKKKFF